MALILIGYIAAMTTWQHGTVQLQVMVTSHVMSTDQIPYLAHLNRCMQLLASDQLPGMRFSEDYITQLYIQVM